jgi:electron transport complex protein RnfA
MSWIGIIVAFALVDNVLLSRLLGTCPDACAPGALREASGTGAATAALMCVSAGAGWLIDTLVLSPLGLAFLRTPAFVLSAAGLALLLHAGMRLAASRVPAIRRVSVPEVGINCAVLGVVLIVTRSSLTLAQGLLAGLAAGLGYFVVAALLAAIRERLEVESVPRSMRGLPLHLVSAGLMAYAFMAFDRAFLARILGG